MMRTKQRQNTKRLPLILGLLLAVGWQCQSAVAQTIPLTGPQQKRNVNVEQVEYKGRQAVRVTEAATPAAGALEADRLVVLTETQLQDGTIEIELAGTPGNGAVQGARGFVGVAFHFNSSMVNSSAGNGSTGNAADAKFECIYLRPTNGRAEDQVRRNHSVQYISHPDFTWHRLRKEFPEKYESYVDLVPGEWTKVKIEISGTKARLYVHGAAQPTLLIDDLRMGATGGQLGLWIGPGTVAHFANLRVTKTK